MCLDRPRAEEQQRTDLPVGSSLRRERCDLPLLGSELVTRPRVLASAVLAARTELAPRAVGPGSRAQLLERVKSSGKLEAGVTAPVRSAEPLSAAEPCPRALEHVAQSIEQLQRLFEEAVAVVGTGDERTAARVRTARPVEVNMRFDLVETGTRLVEATWHQTIAEFPSLSVGVTYLPIPIGGAIALLFVAERLLLGRPPALGGGLHDPPAFD